MQRITPTKKEVFDELRSWGCCWLGCQGCECKSRQLRVCYTDAERRLTRTEYTEEEIREAQERNAKEMKELSDILDEYFL